MKHVLSLNPLCNITVSNVNFHTVALHGRRNAVLCGAGQHNPLRANEEEGQLINWGRDSMQEMLLTSSGRLTSVQHLQRSATAFVCPYLAATWRAVSLAWGRQKEDRISTQIIFWQWNTLLVIGWVMSQMDTKVRCFDLGDQRTWDCLTRVGSFRPHLFSFVNKF